VWEAIKNCVRILHELKYSHTFSSFKYSHTCTYNYNNTSIYDIKIILLRAWFSYTKLYYISWLLYKKHFHGFTTKPWFILWLLWFYYKNQGSFYSYYGLTKKNMVKPRLL